MYVTGQPGKLAGWWSMYVTGQRLTACLGGGVCMLPASQLAGREGGRGRVADKA